MNGSLSMKKLFIYYSLTGNGDEVGTFLSKKGYELCKVKEKSKMPKSFFLSMMVGGFRAGVGLKGKLIDYHPGIEKYDEIVIGSPIWNGKLPPATNAILAKTNFEGKKLSFIIYAGGGEAPKTVQRLNKEYPGASIAILKEPKKHPGEYEKLKDF